MVGAVVQVLARAAAEFGVGDDQRIVPAPELRQRALERRDAIAELPQQVVLRHQLVGVGIETAQRQAHRRHIRAAAPGGRHHLHGGLDGVAEGGLRKARLEVELAALGTQAIGSLDDVRLDLQHVRERCIARGVRRHRQPGFVEEGIRAGQRHGAGAAVQRAEIRAADDDAIRAERRGHRPGCERPRQPPFVQILVGARGGVPDLDGAEMRQIGLRIRHPLHHRELARLPQRHQRLQGRMQAIAIVELQHLLALDGDARAQRVVLRAGIRDHGVEPVIAALELDQDQQVAVPIALAPPLRKDNARQRATHAEHRTRFQKIATFHDVLRRLG
ncbi:hypothetical protein GO283_01060 [Ralstonia solanacearum]|nr:hypothetical protein [Ralstonia solanacearum]NKA88911.1 hypothetical protein [Ralstonia solanacearum]NKA92639.1 hypothetical protein [Ralstonia solanacearum]NKF79904.1 hypothetical protein [Ralstonia solanacearum]NKF94327.1 hypothetical protein [Ralstonia solanacearum]